MSESLRPHAAPLLDAMLADAEQRARLITRYVRGELEGDLLIAFEIRLLDDSTLLADTELESALHKGMRALTPRELGTGAWRLMPARLRLAKLPSPASMTALAASLVMGLAMGIWWRGGAIGPGEAHPSLPMLALAPARFLQVDVVRGADTAASTMRLAVPAGEGHVVVRVPAPNDAGPFRARLLGPLGELASIEPLTADEEGLISLDAGLDVLQRANRLTVDSARGSDWAPQLEIVLLPADTPAR
jgi:hypothetical protein